MTDLAALAAACDTARLAIFGAFHPDPADAVPVPAGTLVLIGPAEPGFWPHLLAAPEWADRTPDPVDRWSRRVITGLARQFGAQALFPFGGPPYHPFYRWALRSGRAWASPVTLLVHDTAGLWLSYRGALALPERLDLPSPPAAAPCASCPTQPCRTACPASALTPSGYDLPACHAFLDSEPGGAACMGAGCRVRAACPVSRRYGRLDAQSAYHMGQFHR